MLSTFCLWVRSYANPPCFLQLYNSQVMEYTSKSPVGPVSWDPCQTPIHSIWEGLDRLFSPWIKCMILLSSHFYFSGSLSASYRYQKKDGNRQRTKEVHYCHLLSIDIYHLCARRCIYHRPQHFPQGTGDDWCSVWPAFLPEKDLQQWEMRVDYQISNSGNSA